MAARILAFLFCMAIGGVPGWWFGGFRVGVLGLLAGAIAWAILESLRALKVRRWLRRGDYRTVPRVAGLWGEAADRFRRALLVREKQAAEAEHRLEDFLAALRASPNGVVLLDRQARIEWLNETAAAHLGLDPGRDLQQYIVNLVRDPGFAAFFQETSANQDVVIAGPGSTAARPRKISLRLHPYGEGRMLLLSRDVTAVEQAEHMRRDFVANVSHEIRTPLTVLSGYVETMLNLELPAEERKRYLQTMAQQAQRMQTLVNDLLTLSRLEGSPLPGAAEWTDVAQLLAQCRQEAEAIASALNKKLQLRFAPAPEALVAGAGGELTSALSNLVGNAVRYTPSGGSVDVAATLLPGGRIEFSVKDTGPGVAPEHLPRLTERFYRVDRSRSRETGGTGLGLAIVKHVVQRHGGELKLESTLGAGSSFGFVLPAARVRAAGSTPADSAERPATEPAAG
ncbi:phosphate regulon sensor histidine kinase PhoR [Ramlibacter sp. XY19]|uniref:phosphate regulon sensor histidine kinase PhoR n=1 Tax=Ramlibacter paludis TaxID=2908000 RepID=UPI0023DBBA98|nr:phosphate regulon sensor histidine kinase PhoR [Ramlibacter paludis]MCG2594998.1 phosphate regulon sensor histidine kinase PhoR [Ramlibacter paludis]